MQEMNEFDILSISGGIVPLAIYFIAGVVIGATGTSVGMYWASTSK